MCRKWIVQTDPLLLFFCLVKMSVITLQLGQCGNQIGSQLFSTLYEDACSTLGGGRRPPSSGSYYESSIERFFEIREKTSCLQARAVLVDMESKVVHQTMLEAKRRKQWEYDTQCVYTQKRGSGNNWANGYCKHGPTAVSKVLDKAQKQAERCDRLDGFLVLMSVAGGTGSGVGAYVTECLRDCFPHSTIMNQVVWPYASGEVIVQGYNTILTTAHLQKVSDAILVLQNDQLHKACSKLLLLKHISFADVNKVICHTLASMLQPSVKFEHFSSSSARTGDPLLYKQCSLTDLHTQLCPHPSFKLLSLKSIPQMPERSHAYSKYLWTGLLKHLRQMLITDSPIEEGMDWSLQLEKNHRPLFSYSSYNRERVSYIHHGINKSLANLLILRGNELDTADITPFHDAHLYTSWVPKSHTCSVWCSSHSFNRYEKCCTLVSNSQSCVQPLDSVCQRAWNMFSARAYIHQYLSYGFSEEEFLESFLTVEQLLKDYTTL